MTSPNEICENCGHTDTQHVYGNCQDWLCSCKKFTPRIEKKIDKMNERWGKDKLFMANLGKRIHELKLQLSEKDKLLSSLQKKIEGFGNKWEVPQETDISGEFEFVQFKETSLFRELLKLFKEKGQ